jgi:hypothetical protein
MSHYPSLHTKAIFVPVFDGLNFSEWKEQVEFHLGVLDLDFPLSEENRLLLLMMIVTMKRKLTTRLGKSQTGKV